jgi:hypothetical protein
MALAMLDPTAEELVAAHNAFIDANLDKLKEMGELDLADHLLSKKDTV